MSGLMQRTQIILTLGLFDHLETYIAKNSANTLSHPVGCDTNDLDIGPRVRKIGHLFLITQTLRPGPHAIDAPLFDCSCSSFKTWRSTPIRARTTKSP